MGCCETIQGECMRKYCIFFPKCRGNMNYKQILNIMKEDKKKEKGVFYFLKNFEKAQLAIICCSYLTQIIELDGELSKLKNELFDLKTNI